MNKKGKIALILAGMGFFLWGVALPQDPPVKAAEEIKPLLRTDLLRSLDTTLKPPRRNIFSPEKAVDRTGTMEGQLPGAENPEEGVFDPEEDSSPGEVQTSAISMRYLGYVRAANKIVALVMHEGMASAVQTGDLIGVGLQIGEITEETIEVVGPDSKSHSFPLEGDQQ